MVDQSYIKHSILFFFASALLELDSFLGPLDELLKRELKEFHLSRSFVWGLLMAYNTHSQ